MVEFARNRVQKPWLHGLRQQYAQRYHPLAGKYFVLRPRSGSAQEMDPCTVTIRQALYKHCIKVTHTIGGGGGAVEENGAAGSTSSCKTKHLPISGSPTSDTQKQTERSEFITPPRPTGRRSNNSSHCNDHMVLFGHELLKMYL